LAVLTPMAMGFRTAWKCAVGSSLSRAWMAQSPRGVTSDPDVADTDGDGLSDAQEMNLGFDPRNVDTDGDQLSDWAEFNEIYSNGLD